MAVIGIGFGLGGDHMTSGIATQENSELSENPSNGQGQANTAGESRRVARSQLNQEGERLLQEAQRRDRLALLGTSAVVFAHEVGNPLHAIFGALEFIETELRRRQIVDPVFIAMIEGAMRETNRLRALLGQFRSLANGQNLDLQFVDLAKIVEEVLALQRLEYPAVGIVVKLECEKSLPLVMLDRAKITQAIVNLCKNAVEAMPDGGCLTIRVFLAGHTVVMEIADTGVGVPDGVHAFQLFITTKPDGSGLGLPVVQQIVSAHKGTISYVTELGRGTTFTVILPAENRN
jgi:signal transduction histidine kinase